MDRSDRIGAACAVAAIGLVAWLSHDSWAIADCREILRSAEFAREDSLDPAGRAELAELRARLAAGNTSPPEAACIARVGLPFPRG